MYEEIDADRRWFLSIAAVALGGARLRVPTTVKAQTPSTKTLGELNVATVLNVGAVPHGIRRTAPFLNRLLAVDIGDIRPDGPVHMIEEIL